MNPRLYIAAHALQGLLARFPFQPPVAAARAVQFADALLVELAKTAPAAAASTSVPPAETAARGQGGR